MQQSVPYMSAKEAAQEWGISQRRVSVLCGESRIIGATIIGNMWLIPKHAEKPVDARQLKRKIEPAKPFVKWAGGKGQLLSEIKYRLPKGFGLDITKYAEPFVGGGALLFDILQKYNLEQVYISDTNKALISSYHQIKTNCENLIEELGVLQGEYLALNIEDRKQYYYKKRELFNQLNIGELKDELMLAALMIFINKTCFNGLYRVNRKGEYNVPMGDYKKPLICDENNLRSISKLLQKVDMYVGDYRQSLEFIDDKTFVYFDPPYRPLSTTASFTSYTEGGFGDKEQEHLAEYARVLTERGAKVMLSNSDPKNINSQDNFFDELYKEFNIQRVNASRMINSNAESRGKITELLITNY